MTAQERIKNIKQLLMIHKKAQVSDLSKRFEVTEETIRRDLEKLEKEGFLTRTHGGAVINAENKVAPIDFIKRATTQLEEKQKIAENALVLFENISTIAADSSSTVMEALKLIRDRKDITLLTNSTEAIRELIQSELTIISTGGIVNKNSLSLEGIVAKTTIKKYSVDLLLISCKGIDKEKGITDSITVEEEIKKLFLSQAGEVALLLDHTKFDKTFIIQICDFGKINYIVTDGRPDEEWMRIFEKNDIQVLY